MAEASVGSREEQVSALLAAVLLAGCVVLFLLQLPALVQREIRLSPWTYVPGLLSFFVAVWKRSDAVAQLAIVWLSILLMVDVVYGSGLFN